MKDSLILRCCVDFPLGNYFPCSGFKGYDPQISVDMLTFLIDSTCLPVSKRRIAWFCDAVLTIHLEIIFSGQVSKGMTPKSVLTFLINSTCHPVSKRRIPWFYDAALTFHLEIIFHGQVLKGMTPKSVLMCWHSWLTALASQLAEEGCPDFAMLCWLSIWKLFSMLGFQRVWPPNQCWRVVILDWQHLPPS